MRFIYFGSSQFSQAIFAGLYQRGFSADLVVSKPDKPKGRGLKVSETKLSTFSKSKDIPLIKPQSLSKSSVYNELANVEADIFIIADYGNIIPANLLNIPKILPIGVHPSLLPFYRGPAPIEQALLDGREETGVTLFKVNERVDAGDVMLQRKIPIDYNDDFFMLSKKLAEGSVSLLIEAFDKISRSDYSLDPQDEKLVTFTSKFKKNDGKINWQNSAEIIRNLIRATLGWPSSYATYKNQVVKILKADVLDITSSDSAGTIIGLNKKGIQIVTSEGVLLVTEVRPEGKVTMDAWSFACGQRTKVGEKFY